MKTSVTLIVSTLLTASVAILTAAPVAAQLAICTTPQRPDCPKALAGVAKGEFTFSRLIFSDNQQAIEDLGDRIGYPHWQADYDKNTYHSNC